MHSSYNLIKSNNASINGGIEIITERLLSEEEQHSNEVENNQIKSYEIIGSRILGKARSDAESIVVNAYKQAKDIEKEAYDSGYKQGMSNGYEDGSSKGYIDASNKSSDTLAEAVKKADEILRNAENQVKEYKIKKKSEIIAMSLEMAKLIVKKEFQNDESILNLITPIIEQCKGEENLIIKCNGNYIAAIETKVKGWKKTYAISGEIFVIEDPLMELGNAVIEKSTGKLIVGVDVSLKKLEEAIQEFYGEEKNA
ncbi:MAG: flagellar biosynthesis/type III secretory pathway-like protein [Clostridium sp.]|nr:flagellar biosynthesis/type III secretory pathway-like protein [Clostridium sp.]